LSETGGFAASVLLHGAIIFILSYSIPFGVREEFFDIPPVITVDVVSIGEETVINQPPPKKPVEEAPPAPPPPKPKANEKAPEPEDVAALPEEPKPAPKEKKVEPKKPEPAAEKKAEKAAEKPKEKPKPEIDEKAALEDFAKLIDRSKEPEKSVDEAEQDFFSTFGKDKPQTQTADSRASAINLIDAARNQVQRCWAPPLGARDAAQMRVTVTVLLGPDGGVIGAPTLDASDRRRTQRSNETVFRTFAESAIRAVQKCAPYELPKARYTEWRTLRLNFDPSQMIN